VIFQVEALGDEVFEGTITDLRLPSPAEQAGSVATSGTGGRRCQWTGMPSPSWPTLPFGVAVRTANPFQKGVGLILGATRTSRPSPSIIPKPFSRAAEP
jgi:hypothetical protein